LEIRHYRPRLTSFSAVFLSANLIIHYSKIGRKSQISSQNMSFYLQIQFKIERRTNHKLQGSTE
jgi:hypothetical protein